MVKKIDIWIESLDICREDIRKLFSLRRRIICACGTDALYRLQISFKNSEIIVFAPICRFCLEKLKKIVKKKEFDINMAFLDNLRE